MNIETIKQLTYDGKKYIRIIIPLKKIATQKVGGYDTDISSDVN